MSTPDRTERAGADSTDTDGSEAPTPSTDISDIEADIARRREHLGETVDELADRLNVKAQAQRKVDEVKERGSAEVQLRANRVRSGDPAEIAAVVAPVLAVVAGIVLVVVLARRRRR